MSLTYTTRPLSDRTWLRPAAQRQLTRFDSTWTATQQLLADELRHLGGRQVVIEVDVREQDIRQDGQLRANARTPDHPAVVVAFETSDHGPMQYRCDRFIVRWADQGPAWQHNVRAIALTLQALRAVDRYGATDTGQQYAGFKAIGGGSPASEPSNAAAARSVLRAYAGAGLVDREHLLDTMTDQELVRYARRTAHPDRNGGDHDPAYAVDQAAQVLGVDR